MRKLIVWFGCALLVVILMPTSASAGNRLVINFLGLSAGRPANTASGEPAGAVCFDADLQDLRTGRTIGTGTDCLADITPVGEGVALVATTFFKLPGGTIVVRGDTTVQLKTTGTRAPGDGTLESPLAAFTHVTGAAAPGNAIVAGTGRFRNASGTARLSGMVDLTSFPATAFFDCIFVLDLD